MANLSVKGRMNIVSWMATNQDDGAWDGRELQMLKLAAQRRNGSSFTKSGVGYMTGLYNDPAAKFVGDAKDKLHDILVGEMGVDPAKLTGADKTQTLRDFEKLGRQGKLAFLTTDRDLRPTEIGLWDIPSQVVRDRVGAAESDVHDWATARYQEIWDDLGWEDFSLEGAIEDDHGGFNLERLEKDGETYGFAITHTYNQGEQGFTRYLDHQGRQLGERDVG